MGLDLRWPIGLMFTLIGTMLTITGFVTRSDANMYKGSLGIDINLWWGLVLLAFGIFMLIMAIFGKKDYVKPSESESAAREEKHDSSVAH